MGEFQPDEVYEIPDLETLKTIADPLRTQILERLVTRPQTVKEIAAKLGLAPSRLYYHINLLEEHGLIKVVDQRMVANLVEKVYRATAYNFEAAPSLLSFDTREGKLGINTVLVNTLDATREDLVRSLDARSYALDMGAPERPRQTIMSRLVHRLPESQAEELQARFKTLLKAFEDAAVDEAWNEDEAHVYALTVAFYPRFDYPASQEDASNEDASNEDASSERGQKPGAASHEEVSGAGTRHADRDH
jgi:DNA-binding transcriptional ArsR family regulator